MKRHVIASARDKEVMTQIKVPEGCELLFSYLNEFLYTNFDICLVLGEVVKEVKTMSAEEHMRLNRRYNSLFPTFADGLAAGLHIPKQDGGYTVDFLDTAWALATERGLL
jgi:hypothetical protein